MHADTDFSIGIIFTVENLIYVPAAIHIPVNAEFFLQNYIHTPTRASLLLLLPKFFPVPIFSCSSQSPFLCLCPIQRSLRSLVNELDGQVDIL